MAKKVIFARAQPERVRLIETYFYDREISRNPSTRPGQAPTGQIEVVVPYDGHQYFTRCACQDVKHQLRNSSSEEEFEALIGYLVLSDYGRTDLERVLKLADRYGSVPIHVPVVGKGITKEDQLHDDQNACYITYDYSPQWPDVTPIDIGMVLLDEDILELPNHEPSAEYAKQLGNVVSQIIQQVSFQRNLLLSTQVTLDLPYKLAANNLNPKVVRVSLSWPTITSFRALHLTIGDHQTVPWRYNPSTLSVEWADVPMKVSRKSAGTELRTYVSEPMSLLINQPGELYQQISLDGQVEVEIPGLLLSGLKTRLYNCTGKLMPNLETELSTRLISNLHLILDDAFARRTLSSYQHLYFDGVIPDKMRIADIRTALADRGFRINQDHDLGSSRDEMKHFILALRPEGPDTLNLSIYIEGNRYTTERQSQVPGGQTYTSTFESGDLKVYMRGQLPGNSCALIQEMNAFQASLRDRFERLRAKR